MVFLSISRGQHYYLKSCNFRNIIIWLPYQDQWTFCGRRRSRVSKATHLKGCIKKLPVSILVRGGGGGKQGGLVRGRGSGVKPQKGFHWKSMKISWKTKARTDVSTLVTILNCTVVKYINFLTRIVPNVLL